MRGGDAAARAGTRAAARADAEDGGTVSTELATLQLALGQQPVMRLSFDAVAGSGSAAPAQPDAERWLGAGQTITLMATRERRCDFTGAGLAKARKRARFALYRCFVGWEFASPLGREKRVVLPACVLKAIRTRFPSPCCGPACDYLDGCEANRHYKGFRTVQESRTEKQGQSSACDGAVGIEWARSGHVVTFVVRP